MLKRWNRAQWPLSLRLCQPTCATSLPVGCYHPQPPSPLGLPGVQSFTGMSSFLGKCPVIIFCPNRTMQCPVFGWVLSINKCSVAFFVQERHFPVPKTVKNHWAVPAPPQTLLGELTALPRLLSWRGGTQCPSPRTQPRLSIRPRLWPFWPLAAALWALHRCEFVQLNTLWRGRFFRCADLATLITIPQLILQSHRGRRVNLVQ